MTARSLLPVGTLVGSDFRVVMPLRGGGMGMVYVVDQISTGKRRAMKVLAPEYACDGASLERFVREARVASRIESVHVVEVIAAGVDRTSGLPYLVMELLRGEDLAELLKRTGPLPLGDVAEVARQAGHALALAHEAGVVHRDLKPENLFASHARRGDVPFTIKVLDFGIAKIVADSHKTGTQPLGTPVFMSPEQTDRLGKITPASDVWAFGLVIFRLLTGRDFWRGADGSVPVLLREIVLEPIASASARAAEFDLDVALPAGFDDWFDRCVRRDANERFADAAQAVRALLAIVPEGAPAGALAPQVSSTPPPSASFEARPRALSTPSTLTETSPAPPSASHLATPALGAPPTTAPPEGAPPRSAPPLPRVSGGDVFADRTPAVAAGHSAAADRTPLAHAPERAPEGVPAPPHDPDEGEPAVRIPLGPPPAGDPEAFRTPTQPALERPAPPPSSRRSGLVGAAVGLLVVLVGVVSFVATRTPGGVPPAPSPVASAVRATSAAAAASGAPAEATAPATCPAGMVLIAAGSMFMGASDGPPEQRPAHKVNVGDFCLDKTEVTAGAFASCVEAGQCAKPPGRVDYPGISTAERAHFSDLCNAPRPELGDHPMNCVDWATAAAFCKTPGGRLPAGGARLPTEIEWEYAARGPGQRSYPWGDEPPAPDLLNACGTECVKWAREHHMRMRAVYDGSDGFAATSPVGAFAAGRTPEGVSDLAGNVGEWVDAWFAPYAAPAQRTGERVVRGGGFMSFTPDAVKPSARVRVLPKSWHHSIGFRCASSPQGALPAQDPP